jgi:nitrogen regulatory protein P-II 1
MSAMPDVSVTPLPTGTRARIVAIVRPVRIEPVMEALHAFELSTVLIEPVRGYGRQKAHLEFYEEGPVEGGYLPKVRLQFTVAAKDVDAAVGAVIDSARTGRIGDGKIFVHEVAST